MVCFGAPDENKDKNYVIKPVDRSGARGVFLVNFKPWNGNGEKKFIENTYSTILNSTFPSFAK